MRNESVIIRLEPKARNDLRGVGNLSGLFFLSDLLCIIMNNEILNNEIMNSMSLFHFLKSLNSE